MRARTERKKKTKIPKLCSPRGEAAIQSELLFVLSTALLFPAHCSSCRRHGRCYRAWKRSAPCSNELQLLSAEHSEHVVKWGLFVHRTLHMQHPRALCREPAASLHTNKAGQQWWAALPVQGHTTRPPPAPHAARKASSSLPMHLDWYLVMTSI